MTVNGGRSLFSLGINVNSRVRTCNSVSSCKFQRSFYSNILRTEVSAATTSTSTPSLTPPIHSPVIDTHVPKKKLIDKDERNKKVDKVFRDILNLSVMELYELTEKMKKQFGYEPPQTLSSAAIAAMNAAQSASPAAVDTKAAPAAAAAAAPASNQTEWAVKLESFDEAKKINVIKEVRQITGLGLKQAKDLVSEAPKIVKKGLSKEEAQKIMDTLTAAGAVCKIE